MFVHISISRLILLTAALVLGLCVQASGKEVYTSYEPSYLLAGLLLRSAAVCDGDAARTLDAGLGLIDAPKLKKISNGHPGATEVWMTEGADAFNERVTTDGVTPTCKYAMMLREKAESMTKQASINPGLIALRGATRNGAH
jgi:hypothetical protein